MKTRALKQKEIQFFVIFCMKCTSPIIFCEMKLKNKDKLFMAKQIPLQNLCKLGICMHDL